MVSAHGQCNAYMIMQPTNTVVYYIPLVNLKREVYIIALTVVSLPIIWFPQLLLSMLGIHKRLTMNKLSTSVNCVAAIRLTHKELATVLHCTALFGKTKLYG